MKWGGASVPHFRAQIYPGNLAARQKSVWKNTNS